MKNFLCKIGLHNWKLIDIQSTAQLQSDVKYEQIQCNCEEPCFCKISPRIIMDGFGGCFKEKKVCRHCLKIHDTISPYKKKIKSKVLKELELEKYANASK